MGGTRCTLSDMQKKSHKKTSKTISICEHANTSYSAM